MVCNHSLNIVAKCNILEMGVNVLKCEPPPTQLLKSFHSLTIDAQNHSTAAQNAPFAKKRQDLPTELYPGSVTPLTPQKTEASNNRSSYLYLNFIKR